MKTLIISLLVASGFAASGTEHIYLSTAGSVKVQSSPSELPRAINVIGIFDSEYEKDKVIIQVEACNKLFTFKFKKSDIKAQPDAVVTIMEQEIKNKCGW